MVSENARPGTQGWPLAGDPATWDKIRGFADRTSVNRGGSFSLFVDSGASWHVEAYRVGYYGGAGARLVWTSTPIGVSRQAPAVTDPVTGMIQAPWMASIAIRVTDDWVPGMYLLKLLSDDGGGSYVPLVIRDDDSHAALLVQSSVTTWQAYNNWGGSNLYTGPKGNPKTRSRISSFDRPYGGNGSGEFFGRESEFVFFAERRGLDVSYWTDIDLHEQPDRALQHRAVVSLGHDEYYSTSMRGGLERARDNGVNVAFLGANAAFRKIRFEPSNTGPDRQEVNYRVAKDDPLNQVNPSEVTVSWRDPPSNNPESSLTGALYECNPVKADLVIADTSSWVFDGTGLRDGDHVPNAIGNEYDRVTPERPMPPSIQVLAHSPVKCKNKETFADMSYYTTASGAGVFDAGTFWIEPLLNVECPSPTTSTQCGVQRTIENLMRGFSEGPAGRKHPSVPNLAKLGITAHYLDHGWPTTPPPPPVSRTIPPPQRTTEPPIEPPDAADEQPAN